MSVLALLCVAEVTLKTNDRFPRNNEWYHCTNFGTTCLWMILNFNVVNCHDRMILANWWCISSSAYSVCCLMWNFLQVQRNVCYAKRNIKITKTFCYKDFLLLLWRSSQFFNWCYRLDRWTIYINKTPVSCYLMNLHGTDRAKWRLGWLKFCRPVQRGRILRLNMINGLT